MTGLRNCGLGFRVYLYNSGDRKLSHCCVLNSNPGYEIKTFYLKFNSVFYMLMKSESQIYSYFPKITPNFEYDEIKLVNIF